MAHAQEWTDRRLVEGARQRAVLITIDYEGYGFTGDGDRFRGRAIAVHAPKNFSFRDRSNEVVMIDNEISRMQLSRSSITPEQMRDNVFHDMERQLLRATRELAPHGPELALIPIYEYRNMEKRIKELEAKLNWQKTDNRHLAHQSVIVRNDALRWKALATKLKLQRDAALGVRVRRFFRRALTSVKRVL